MKYLKSLTIFIALQCAIAEAGVGAHGGNVVSCPGQETVTLDYFNASLPTVSGPVQLVPVLAMTEDEAFQFVRSRFDGSPFQETFDQHALAIGPTADWIEADLKSIDDSNEPYALPPNCVRLTAAARQGSSMYIDPTVLKTLSPAQVGLLHAHEVLYEISNEDSSAPVRDLFRVMLALHPNYLQMNLLMKPFGRFAAWDYLGGSWTQEPNNPVDLPGTFYGPLEGSRNPGLVYFVVDLKSRGDYITRGDYKMSCDLANQSCVVTAQTFERGQPPDLVGCKITAPGSTTMMLNCPQWHGAGRFQPGS